MVSHIVLEENREREKVSVFNAKKEVRGGLSEATFLQRSEGAEGNSHAIF